MAGGTFARACILVIVVLDAREAECTHALVDCVRVPENALAQRARHIAKHVSFGGHVSVLVIGEFYSL